jgi:hypothetical protein
VGFLKEESKDDDRLFENKFEIVSQQAQGHPFHTELLDHLCIAERLLKPFFREQEASFRQIAQHIKEEMGGDEKRMSANLDAIRACSNENLAKIRVLFSQTVGLTADNIVWQTASIVKTGRYFLGSGTLRLRYQAAGGTEEVLEAEQLKDLAKGAELCKGDTPNAEQEAHLKQFLKQFYLALELEKLSGELAAEGSLAFLDGDECLLLDCAQPANSRKEELRAMVEQCRASHAAELKRSPRSLMLDRKQVVQITRTLLSPELDVAAKASKLQPFSLLCFPDVDINILSVGLLNEVLAGLADAADAASPLAQAGVFLSSLATRLEEDGALRPELERDEKPVEILKAFSLAPAAILRCLLEHAFEYEPPKPSQVSSLTP